MVLRVRQERKMLHKGAARTGPGEFAFTHPDLLEVLSAFNTMK
jgi:hypothetical protein